MLCPVYSTVKVSRLRFLSNPDLDQIHIIIQHFFLPGIEMKLQLSFCSYPVSVLLSIDSKFLFIISHSRLILLCERITCSFTDYVKGSADMVANSWLFSFSVLQSQRHTTFIYPSNQGHLALLKAQKSRNVAHCINQKS